MGPTEEMEAWMRALRLVSEVTSVSEPYPNRGSTDVRVFVHARLPEGTV